jgi:hypothetical protein
MKLYLVVLFILFSFLCDSKASEVSIFGNASSYAGEKLTFYTYHNRITDTRNIVGQPIVEKNGNFRLTFNLDQTRYVFAELGIYHVFLFAEPGKTYEIVLPKKKDKTTAQILNPFFEERKIHTGIKNSEENDLNFLIKTFESSYQPYFQKHVVNVMVENDFSAMDSAIQSMKAPYKDADSPYFLTYMKYKFGFLRYMAYQKKSRDISDRYFLKEPVQYYNVAYMELFNKVYDKYFSFFSRTDYGKAIFVDISENKSWTGLKETLSKDDVLKNDTLLELVALKSLHDEFYSDQFSRSAIMAILDSIQMKSSIKIHNEIARDIKNKISKLLVGYAPPAFQLYDKDSTLVGLDSLKGNYVYLNFCSCLSYACLNEFGSLDRFIERVGTKYDNIKIVTIVVDEKFKTMERCIDRYGYEWTFLHYASQPAILKDYDIRGFPTYFLVGPDGNLLMSPAPSPSENFGERLFEIMRNKGDLYNQQNTTF